MKNRILWALAGLNVLLLVTLAGRFMAENRAMAQAARRPADYIMIPGEVTGGSGAVVYIIDTSNGLLGAGAYDDAAKAITTMPPIDLARVFETAAPPAPRAPAVAPGGGAQRVPPR